MAEILRRDGTETTMFLPRKGSPLHREIHFQETFLLLLAFHLTREISKPAVHRKPLSLISVVVIPENVTDPKMNEIATQNGERDVGAAPKQLLAQQIPVLTALYRLMTLLLGRRIDPLE